MYRLIVLYIMRKTNLDLSVLITQELIKKGLIGENQPSDGNNIRFQTENLIMDVLDKLLPYNREHL